MHLKTGSQQSDHPAQPRLPRVESMTAPKRVLAEVAVGMALRDAPKALPPRFENGSLPLSGIAVRALIADVGVFMIDAAMIVGFS